MLPQFTAEASLYATKQRYQMVAMTDQSRGRTQPALVTSMLNICFGQCAARCLQSWGGVDFYGISRCIEMCGPPLPSVRSYAVGL
jgi:hypothetical protein